MKVFPHQRIIRNSVHCLGCDTELVSTHRHHYASCPCGTAADGGTEYLRRAYPVDQPDLLQETSILGSYCCTATIPPISPDFDAKLPVYFETELCGHVVYHRSSYGKVTYTIDLLSNEFGEELFLQDYTLEASLTGNPATPLLEIVFDAEY